MELKQDASTDIRGLDEHEAERTSREDTKISQSIFRHDHLDRRLERHHITGIAFSGAVGVGLFQTSGQVVALGGQVGALLAFLFAALVVISVMRSIAEMASVRPVKGAVLDYPYTFVDEALGFAVGLLYTLANCMSMVTLTMAAAMFTQYWRPTLGLGSATFVLLVAITLMNACGVRLYGNLEWCFKHIKIFLILFLCITMIAIKIGAGPKPVQSGSYTLAPGYTTNGFYKVNGTISTSPEAISKVAIAGTGGRILTVWTCITIAIFQFLGGEMVLATAAEAKSPRRDIPVAARYMYLLPVTFYLVAVILVGLCVDYLDPLLPRQHLESTAAIDDRPAGVTTATASPFVIVIMRAGIGTLPSFFNAAFLFSALTAANSALYVASRTLFFMAQNSGQKGIRDTVGRANNGYTPLAAILTCVIPGGLAFLVVKASSKDFHEPSRPPIYRAIVVHMGK
ncbi:hypothetical protein ACLMJK_004535 [Lecanora helva]